MFDPRLMCPVIKAALTSIGVPLDKLKFVKGTALSQTTTLAKPVPRCNDVPGVLHFVILRNDTSVVPLNCICFSLAFF